MKNVTHYTIGTCVIYLDQIAIIVSQCIGFGFYDWYYLWIYLQVDDKEKYVSLDDIELL